MRWCFAISIAVQCYFCCFWSLIVETARVVYWCLLELKFVVSLKHRTCHLYSSLSTCCVVCVCVCVCVCVRVCVWWVTFFFCWWKPLIDNIPLLSATTVLHGEVAKAVAKNRIRVLLILISEITNFYEFWNDKSRSCMFFEVGWLVNDSAHAAITVESKRQTAKGDDIGRSKPISITL